MSSTAQFSWDEMVLLDDLVSSGEVKLGRGNVISKIDIRNNPGTYPIYSSSSKNQGKMGEYGSFMFDEELISWSVDGGGYVFYRPKHKFSVTNVSGYMRLVGEWDYKFVAYVLQFQHEYFSFDYQAKAHPSVIREFYLFPRIPLPEQQKIAAILSSVDDVIEKTRAQIDKLKDLKTGMMQELLTKGIGHTAFKDSPVGRIPLSWSVLNVDQLQSKEKYSCVGGPFGSDLTSKHYVDDAGVPVIRGANLPLDSRRFIDEGFVFVSDEKADSLVRNMAYPGDLVITQRGTIGQIGLIPDDSNYKRYVISQSQMKLAVDEEVIDKEFLYQFFLSDGFLRDLDKETIATGLPHINLGILKSFWVSVPPLKEQGEILRVLNSVDDKDKKLQAALATYCALKKALMQDLLTGKVRVNVDNKENAVA